MSCHWSFDPQWVKISGHSEQLGPCGSTSHFVNNRHSRVKTQGASCNGGFGQTGGQRKFKLGIPKSRVAAYVRGASYIREKTVLRAAELSEVQQILVEHDIQKVYCLKLILVFLKKHFEELMHQIAHFSEFSGRVLYYVGTGLYKLKNIIMLQ